MLAGTSSSNVSFIVVCTANTRGLLEPCGCQATQPGGLARRATALKRLRQSKVPIVAFEAGNSVSELSPGANVFAETRRLLGQLGYSFLTAGPGEMGLAPSKLRSEMLQPGPVLLGTIGSDLPRVVNCVQSKSVTVGQHKVLAMSINAIFEGKAALPTSEEMSSMRAKVSAARSSHSFVVLVSNQPREGLESIRKEVRGIDLVLWNRPTSSDRDLPLVRQESVVATVPESGRSMLVIRVSGINAAERIIRNETLVLNEKFPKDPVVLARVTKFLKTTQTGTFPLPNRILTQARANTAKLLVESASGCAKCHPTESTQWAATKHALAFKTLKEKGEHRRLDCIGCHTTPADVFSLGDSISGVGCATCHGDGSRHSVSPRTPNLVVRRPGEQVCKSCHTEEASPRFDLARYLPHVRH